MIEMFARVTVRNAARATLLLVVAHATIDAQPAVPRARIVEDLRLDATAHDFPRVGAVYVGPRQHIIVPIAGDGQLRIFDSTGKRVAVVGRTGSGPGEFSSFSSLYWIKDTIWVVDGAARRTTAIGPDFKMLRTVADRAEEFVDASLVVNREAGPTRVSVLGPGPLARNADGSYLGTAVIVPTSDPVQSAWGGGDLLVRVDRNKQRHVIAILPWRGDARWQISYAGFGSIVPFMYWGRPVASWNGDRVAFMSCDFGSATGGTFTVTAFKSSGEKMFERAYPFTGAPVSTAEKDSVLASMLPRPGAPREGPPGMYERLAELARQRIPKFHAGVEFVKLGLDQTVWVGLHRTSAGQPILALNAKGDPLATILVPKNSRFRQANAQHVWMTEADDDGLVSVVRYRISGISCGAQRC